MNILSTVKLFPRKTMCIFCNIEKLSIITQNDRLILIKDIKPATKFHYLVIPREHHVNIKYLDKGHISLIQEMKQMALNYIESNIPEFDSINLRMGFHWAPFNTISHLHLHLLYPCNQMSLIRSWIFRPNSYWFVEVDDAIRYLQSK